jgi:hypothetical protein
MTPIASSSTPQLVSSRPTLWPPLWPPVWHPLDLHLGAARDARPNTTVAERRPPLGASPPNPAAPSTAAGTLYAEQLRGHAHSMPSAEALQLSLLEQQSTWAQWQGVPEPVAEPAPAADSLAPAPALNNDNTSSRLL